MKGALAVVALLLFTSGADVASQKKALDEKAWSEWKAGRMEGSLAAFRQLRALAHATHDRELEARTTNFTGLAYQMLGDLPTAMRHYEEALTMAKPLHDAKLDGEILYHLAWGNFVRGDYNGAITWYEQSLAQRRAAGDHHGEAITLAGLGMAYNSLGNYARAIDYEQQALPLVRAAGDRRQEADVLDHIGMAMRLTGRVSEAIELHKQALAIRRDIGDRGGQTFSLSSLAKAYRLTGNLPAACANMDEVMTVIESARQKLASKTLRESMFAAKQGHYDYALDLNMEAGREAEALAISERGRARLTLDAIQQATNAVVEAQPLSAGAIQRELLDESTALIEYALGDERSFVWIVTSTSLESHVLPKRAVIDAAARRLHELLADGAGRKQQHDVDEASTALATMILPPLALPRAIARIVVVADGALHYIPFAMLTPPRASEPLLARYEIVSAPSASVVALMRKLASGQRVAASGIAVIADPVFRADDPRVGPSPGASRHPLPASRGEGNRETLLPARGEKVAEGRMRGIRDAVMRSARESGLHELARLPYTRAEADAIVALARGSALEATDFDANRSTVTSKRFASQSTLHFATHALLNAQHPEESGIVLSLVDRRGKPIDGFLRAAEIYRLHLGARLVVLSACRTALGKTVRGEGLVGLVRAFMYAGAPSVVASYWDVRDADTAALMKRFYSRMLEQHDTPAAALRSAALSIARENGWRNPRAWAGFAVQGDWR